MTARTQRGSCSTCGHESWSEHPFFFIQSNPLHVILYFKILYIISNARLQVEVIKKAYNQEVECEGVEVSPQEVGHNIYILAQQVTKYELLIVPGRSLHLCFSTSYSFVILLLCPVFLPSVGPTQQIPAEPPETSEEQQRGRGRDLLHGEHPTHIQTNAVTLEQHCSALT